MLKQEFPPFDGGTSITSSEIRGNLHDTSTPVVVNMSCDFKKGWVVGRAILTSERRKY